MDIGDKLYCVEIPLKKARGYSQDTPYTADGIVPVLKDMLDEEFYESVDEAVFLAVRTKDNPFIRAESMDVKKGSAHLPHPVFDQSEEDALNKYVGQLANYLFQYITRNQNKGKLVTIPDKRDDEREVFTAAVEKLNRDHHLSIELEEIV